MPVSLTPPLSDFSTGVAVHSEEDAKQKIIMPYLRSLGYSEKEMRFENPITVQAGSRKVTLYSDIEILVDGRPEIIIDAKKPSHTINDTDVLQVTSYAKLVDVQSAYCAFVTNGHDLKGVNVSTGGGHARHSLKEPTHIESFTPTKEHSDRYPVARGSQHPRNHHVSGCPVSRHQRVQGHY